MLSCAVDSWQRCFSIATCLSLCLGNLVSFVNDTLDDKLFFRRQNCCELVVELRVLLRETCGY